MYEIVLYAQTCIIANKILSTILEYIAAAERSFSTSRGLKTYSINTKSECKLVRLALLLIHKDIEINDEIILHKFNNSGKNRILELNHFIFIYNYYH